MKVTIERADNGFALRTIDADNIDEIEVFESKYYGKVKNDRHRDSLSEAETFLNLVNALAEKLGVVWSKHNKYDFFACIDVDQKVKEFFWDKIEPKLKRVE